MADQHTTKDFQQSTTDTDVFLSVINFLELNLPFEDTWVNGRKNRKLKEGVQVDITIRRRTA